jgi:ABC-type sugar transport system ATPase subunit
MVYVTHDQEEAMTLGHRVIVMRDGAVEQAAAPLDLFAAPANTFVAGFIGSPAMNLWTGLPGAPGVAPANGGAKPGPTVGIRPHDIRLVSPDASDAQLRGRIEIVEALGATTILHVRADGLEPLVRVSAPADAAVATGDRVGLSLRTDRLHRFDAATGRRL